MKKYFTKIGVIIVILTLVFWTFSVQAGALSSMSDTMSRLKASTSADHIIKFVTPSGVAAGQTITVTFASGFTLTGLDFGDFDFAEGSTNNCSTATFTEKVLAATPSGATWGVGISSQVVTITSATGTVTASRCVRIKIGLNANTPADDPAGDATADAQITNPSSGSKTISFAGTFTDTGSLAVAIVDNEQVSITATVDPTFTFTISANTCALGTLAIGSVKTCNYTLAVGTNADDGAVITIQAISDGTNAYLNKDGAPDIYINDIAEDGTVTLGTEGYGVAVTAGADWVEAGDFNDDDTPIPSSATNILTTAGPIASSVTSTITHRAAISDITEAGTYSQTVQYIATGTF